MGFSCKKEIQLNHAYYVFILVDSLTTTSNETTIGTTNATTINPAAEIERTNTTSTAGRFQAYESNFH